MEIGFLREEFLRLSGIYPELRHALIVGDEHWLFDDDYFRVAEQCEQLLRQDFGLEIIDHELMSNDIRSLSFYLWRRAQGRVRADEAVGQFRALARMTAGCVKAMPFPNRIMPQYRVKSGMEVLSLSGKYIITAEPRPDDRDHEWIGHVFANVAGTQIWLKHPKTGNPLRLDVLILPFDSFRASAFAIESAPAAQSAAAEVSGNADQQWAQLAGIIGDDNAAAILAVVARMDIGGEEKLRTIAKIDPRFKGKNSADLASLIGVSDGAIRGYGIWKDWQKERRNPG